ncbi:hypothetical protein TrRE_jg13590, partial [Triparma retinervis]
MVLVASPRKFDKKENKLYFNKTYHLHTAQAEAHGIKMKAQSTSSHQVCVLDCDDYQLKPALFFRALQGRDFHSLTVIAHGVSDPNGGEDGMIAFVDNENGKFYPCRATHFADELFESDKNAKLELLFLNGCCTSILGHAIVDRWINGGRKPPSIIAWKEDVPDLHAFNVSQVFFREYFKSASGNFETACWRVEEYCRLDSIRAAYGNSGTSGADMPALEPDFILPGKHDMKVGYSNAIIATKLYKMNQELLAVRDEVLKMVEVEKSRNEYHEKLARLHPRHRFLYGTEGQHGYLDKKRGVREGENLSGLRRFRFAGREWLFEDVRKWMEREKGEYIMVLLASAGFGKSAFAAQLVEEEMKHDVVAFHFCSNERVDNLNPEMFLKGLVVSLAKNIDGFTAALCKGVEFDVEGVVEFEVGGEPIFDTQRFSSFMKFAKDEDIGPQGLLLDYILPALKKVDGPGEGKVKLVVIDSLDEAALMKKGGDDDHNILDLVAEMAESKEWPNWLKLLVTSRDQINVTEKLKYAKKIDLKVKLEEKEHKENNEKDMRVYLEDRIGFDVIPPELYQMQQALDIVNQNGWKSTDTLGKFVEAIVKKSEGMFLYAVYIVDEIENGDISLDQSIEDFEKCLPNGIYKIYEERMVKMFNKDDMNFYRKTIRPVLQIIAAAREPIPRDVLDKASGMDGAEYDALEQITTFCKVRGEQRGEQDTYAFVHQSFTDWILNKHEMKDNKKFVISEDKGHLAIAKAFVESRKGERESGYLFKHGVWHVASTLESCKMMVGTEEDIINAVDDSGVTALLAAALYGRLECVKVLVEAGADKDKAADDGWTPLYIAAQNGHCDVVKCLIEAGADKDKAMDDGVTPLYIAAQNGHCDVVKCLIEAGADKDKAKDNGMTPLYFAAQDGHCDVVKCLIEAGADKDKAANDGVTPLYVAAHEGHCDVVKCLIEAGADKDKAKDGGATPLYIAALKGNCDVVKCLIEAGADKDKAANFGAT